MAQVNLNKLALISGGLILIGGTTIQTLLPAVHTLACQGCSQRTSFKVQKILRQPYFVNEIVWSRDGKLLAVSSLFHQNVNVYRIRDWTLIAHLESSSPLPEGSYSTMAFTNNDLDLVLPTIQYTNGSRNVALQGWNLKTNTVDKNFVGAYSLKDEQDPHQLPRDNLAKILTLSQDGTLLAAAEGGEWPKIVIYRIDNLSVVQEIACQRDNVPNAISISSDDQTLADAWCYSGDVTVHDILSGFVRLQIPDVHAVQVYNKLQFSQDDNSILVGSSGPDFSNIDIIEVSDGKLLKSFQTQRATIRNLEWNLQNNWIVASYDPLGQDGRKVKVWDAKSGALIFQVAGEGVDGASMSGDAKYLAVAAKNEVVIGEIEEK